MTNDAVSFLLVFSVEFNAHFLSFTTSAATFAMDFLPSTSLVPQ